MDPEEVLFSSFFTSQLKGAGISLKRLSELTGIARGHLENIARGNFGDLPSAPYFHGYIIRIGKVLDFDGEEWWEKVKKEGSLKDTSPIDSLPRNRYVQKSQVKFVWIGIATIIIIYLIFQIPKILGKPGLIVTFPAQTPYTTSSSTATIEGIVKNANSLSLDGDSVTIAGDGSWQKTVLLQSGVNTFEIAAKKFLGGETDVMEQILYTPIASSVENTSTSPTSTAQTK